MARIGVRNAIVIELFALLCIVLLHLLNTALLCIPFVPLLCQGLVCSSPHRLNRIFHVCFLLSPKHLECRLPTMVHPRAMPYSMQQSSSNSETTSNVVPKGTNGPVSADGIPSFRSLLRKNPPFSPQSSWLFVCKQR